MTGKIQPHSIDNRILSRIYGHGMGWVFTPDSFADLGNRAAIDLTLLRKERAGIIRRLARGLYDYPATHPQFGFLAPSPEAVAKALAGRDATRLQPSGAYAANLLGLSEQVPMKIVFLTDGQSRKVILGKQEIALRHTTPRNMAAAGRMSGMVIQALRYLGQPYADDAVVTALRQRLDEKDKKQLLKDLRYAPAWIGAIMRKIARPEEA